MKEEDEVIGDPPTGKGGDRRSDSSFASDMWNNQFRLEQINSPQPHTDVSKFPYKMPAELHHILGI